MLTLCDSSSVYFWRCCTNLPLIQLKVYLRSTGCLRAFLCFLPTPPPPAQPPLCRVCERTWAWLCAAGRSHAVFFIPPLWFPDCIKKDIPLSTISQSRRLKGPPQPLEQLCPLRPPCWLQDVSSSSVNENPVTHAFGVLDEELSDMLGETHTHTHTHTNEDGLMLEIQHTYRHTQWSQA